MASSEITECADTAPSQDRPAPAAFSPGVAALTSIALAGSARSAIDRELLARIDERQRRHIVLSLQRTVGNTTVSALVAPRRLAREIRGDVTQISIDPSFARALTDDELAGQVGLLRGRLATAPDLALQANLAVLENEVLRRNPATQPAPATAPPNGPLPPGAIPLGVVGTPLAAGILQPVTLSTGPGMPPGYAPPTTPQAPPGAWEYRPPPTITEPSPGPGPAGGRDLAKIGVSTGAMIAAVGAFLIVFFYSRPTQPSWMDRNPLTGIGYSSPEEFDQVRQMTPEAFQQEMVRRSGRRWGSMTQPSGGTGTGGSGSPPASDCTKAIKPLMEKRLSRA